MIMKDKSTFLLNSSELHIITGLDLNYCREIFKEYYLPAKSSVSVLEKHTGLDIVSAYNHFRENWFKYRDNADYILNAPFSKSGEFKIKKKIKFILEHINPDHKDTILKNWENKKDKLRSQLSFV